MASINCLNCKYYNLTKTGEGFGECRRYPPKINDLLFSASAASKGFAMDDKFINRGNSVVSASIFPEVWESDWCGEWKKKLQNR